MNTKKPMNIVFYKTVEYGVQTKKACIFYDDGTVENVNYEKALEACEEIVKEQNISSKNAFKEMINKNIVHVVTESELKKNFNSYIYNPLLADKTLDNIISEELNQLENEKVEETKTEEPKISKPVIEKTKIKKENVSKENETTYENRRDTRVIPEIELDENYNNWYEDDEDEDKNGIIRFFKRKIEELKESKIVKKITAVALATAVGVGLYSCTQRKTKDGEITAGILTTEINGAEPSEEEEETKEQNSVKDNSKYDGYTFEQLLEVTTNETQKRVMTNLNTTLNNYNNIFASYYIEKDKNIRAALTFEEAVALQQAYNDYSFEELKAIFNGVYGDFNSTKLSRSYKDASLQLMGAYVIENSEHPVDMSTLIESEEGKEFYNRYHKMFLQAKNATGQDKIEKIKLFYNAVREDFPITEEIRTEGIMHKDAYDEIESYKLSVTPMIAAGEMIWQNLSIDLTLDDTNIDFINDIGLCNYADDKFERIESKSVLFENEKTNPLYRQYKEAIEKNLKDLGYYNIKDSERDISRLDSFQNTVNWHFNVDNSNKQESYFEYYTTTKTNSYTETKTWTENNGTTYRTETTRTEKPITKEAKDRIDREFEIRNQNNRTQAEKEAQEKAKELQAKEDKKAQEIENEIKEEEKDLNQKIEDANKQIDKNNDSDPTNDKPINESDFGDHNVDFDDKHSDSEGNLNDSVENITTDPTGDQTDKELPDPNETGKEFDAKAENNTEQFNNNDNSEPVTTFTDVTPEESNNSNNNEESQVTFVDNTPEEYYPSTEVYTVSEEETIIIEYEIPAETYETKSNEEIVDEYVESLAENPTEEEDNPKVYEK